MQLHANSCDLRQANNCCRGCMISTQAMLLEVNVHVKYCAASQWCDKWDLFEIGFVAWQM